MRLHDILITHNFIHLLKLIFNFLPLFLRSHLKYKLLDISMWLHCIQPPCFENTEKHFRKIPKKVYFFSTEWWKNKIDEKNHFLPRKFHFFWISFHFSLHWLVKKKLWSFRQKFSPLSGGKLHQSLVKELKT